MEGQLTRAFWLSEHLLIEFSDRTTPTLGANSCTCAIDEIIIMGPGTYKFDDGKYFIPIYTVT